MEHMAELARLWNIEKRHVPSWNQPTHVSNLLKYIEYGSVMIFWASGTNPLVSVPNLSHRRELFTQPSLFTICQDINMTVKIST